MTVSVRRLLLLLALAAAGVGAYGLGVTLRPQPEPAGTPIQQPPQVGHLDLVRGDGEAVRLGDVLSGTTLVFFGFVRCPDVCPLTMARLASIYESLGRPEGLSVAMVTVDPEHDTPEVLQRYVQGFHADFVALGGSHEQVAEAARTFWIGYAGAGDASLVHTDVVAVVDGSGALRYIYNQEAMRHLERDLPRLMRRLGA